MLQGQIWVHGYDTHPALSRSIERRFDAPEFGRHIKSLFLRVKSQFPQKRLESTLT
jgi:hypothetical protein